MLFLIVCHLSKFLSSHSQIRLCCTMGKDRPVFDASSSDRRRAFKSFVANFRDFCIIEDYVNSAKTIDSENYRITAKRPKAMAPSQVSWNRMGCINYHYRRSNISRRKTQSFSVAWQAFTTLSWWGTNNSKHTQFSSKAETIARCVYSSVAHSRAFRIPEV